MDCFRCGSSVPSGLRSCPACGQGFATAASAGGRDRAVSHLARRFRLRRVLGEGPIGSVYAARDETRKVDVAVKMIRPELAGSEGDRNVFVVAMGRVDAIEHPNVAPVHECGVDGERCWIVSPLLVGLSLRKLANTRRARRERFVLEEVVPILAQIVDALVAGNPLGPHGDLKPENVVLLPERLVVTDFGLAHAFPSEAFARAQRISPLARSYRAPEVEAGARPTVRADVFALGVMAAEMLAGRPITTPPLDLGTEILPAEAGPVLARAMAEDPDERPESPEDLLAELAAVESGGPLKDSTTVRRRLSEITQKVTLDEIVVVRGDDTEEMDLAAERPSTPPPPREVTQKISVDMIVPEATPTKKASLPPPMPVVAAPVVTAVPGAPETALPPPGPVAGVTRGAPASQPPKARAESTDKWVAQAQIVLFDDSADTALRLPKEPTESFPRKDAPAPSPRSRGAGWLLFAGAAIAGLLLGAGFYWSQHRTPPPPAPIFGK